MNAPPLNGHALQLVKEAAEWHLISLLLECPHGERWQRATRLAAEVDDPVLRQAVECAQHEATESLYHTTFGPGGPAPPREVSYRATIQPGAFLAELAAVYEAFAYSPAVQEPLDHVALEAGFVGYLRLKQAYAASAGRDEAGLVCCQAATGFVEEHLSCLAQPLSESLEASGVHYLALVARGLLQRVGPPRKPANDPGGFEEAAAHACESTCVSDDFSSRDDTAG